MAFLAAIPEVLGAGAEGGAAAGGESGGMLGRMGNFMGGAKGGSSGGSAQKVPEIVTEHSALAASQSALGGIH